MTTPGLPLKPDPQTGQPRPPRAPLENGWRRSEDKSRNGATKVPQPPPAAGPVLEWFHPSHGRLWTFIALSVVVVAGVFTLKDGGLAWMGTWWLWLFFLPLPVFFLARERNLRIAAGADWLAYGNSSLRTYELTKIHVTVGGVAHQLILEDAHGGRLEYVPIHELQLNRELWDLVYLGLLHSTYENGADVNRMAKEYLSLNIPPHLRKWD
ncbi:hypothetical protein GIY23_08370 [Allosaccharopolyspora coralli]|uniref:PH domain-containing protein n=1 Tax=Allosaccharopolyspora coralli TaxID=2665642 RepID=A0A5Q3QFE0_9PSEU|nr:hypothetical protein [Allosaccharopolyspora coralli]QGK69537.1 hypothetical protein GIY23_08370 [Allosaccharopolyspora coralli]